MSKRPTEFRGCTWDDGWEFDAPCVIYHPWCFRRTGAGNNNGCLDYMVEEICSDIVEEVDFQKYQRELQEDMAWRGWGRRFARRRRAEHVVFKVAWNGNEYEIVERLVTLGPRGTK